MRACVCAHVLRHLWGRSHRPALTDLHGHGPRHDVSGGQVLGDGGVALHEPLALTVDENAALPAAPLRDETASAIYPCRDPADHTFTTRPSQLRPDITVTAAARWSLSRLKRACATPRVQGAHLGNVTEDLARATL